MYFPSREVREERDPTFTTKKKWLRKDVMDADTAFLSKRRSIENGTAARALSREELRLMREYEDKDPIALGKENEELNTK